MGTLDETAIIDYRLFFANQGKQTSDFCFRLQQTEGSLPLQFFIFSKQTEVAIFLLDSVFVCGISKTRRHRDMEMETWKFGERHGNMENGAMET
jgi:hypothetical protein